MKEDKRVFIIARNFELFDYDETKEFLAHIDELNIKEIEIFSTVINDKLSFNNVASITEIMNGMLEADEVHVFYTKPEDTFGDTFGDIGFVNFQLGMAFVMGKKIIMINEKTVNEKTINYNFNEILTEWETEGLPFPELEVFSEYIS